MTLRAELRQLTSLVGKLAPSEAGPARDYSRNPVGYVREVLGLDPWATQEQIAGLLLEKPNKVLVKASHSVGKTWLAAALTSWFYDTFRENSCVITTAPTARDVRDLLWTEVRRQRRRAGLMADFAGDMAPEMRTSEDHFAKGFTAAKGESFQGRHFRYMLFIFDEAVGIDALFWETTKSMFRSGGEHFWLAIFNPTSTASQAYIEEQARELDGSPSWHVVQMGSVDHPNLADGLAGREPRYPSAVTLDQFSGWVADWCDPLPACDTTATDLEWPPGSGHWYRPGPLMESRALGRWPSSGTYGVWSDAIWAAACRSLPFVPDGSQSPVIGCDLASHGDDYTEIVVRWGNWALHHERHNGWLEDQTAGRLKQLAIEWAGHFNAARPSSSRPFPAEEIPIHYDGDGRGGSLATHRGDYRFVPICASSCAYEAAKYPNRRSELWFVTALRARQGRLCLAPLPRAALDMLRQQAMAPTWKPNSSGQCEVEKKADTKKRLGRSPDGMDSLNLAFLEPRPFEAPTTAAGTPRPAQPGRGAWGVDSRMGSGRGSRLFGG